MDAVKPPAARAADGTALARCRWNPEGTRGTVLVVHGLGEHAGRYAALAGALAAAGWRVEGYDHRGHGDSAGARGVIPAADSLLTDLAAVIDALREPAAPGPSVLPPSVLPPFVLLGHSMGGAVAARFVAEALAARPAAWSRPVDALVLSSPALAARLTAVQRLQLTLAGALAPGLAVANGIRSAGISSDPAVVAAYDADPRVHDRICARLARFILDAGEAARAAAPRWTTPTLLMWGEADPIVPPEGSRAFAAAAPAAVVEAEGWPGLKHEIFNEREPGRRAVVARLVDWLDRR